MGFARRPHCYTVIRDHRLHLQEKSGIFSCRLCGFYMSQTIEIRLNYRIRGAEEVGILATRLLDLGGPLHCRFRAPTGWKSAVRFARVIRGIYDYPRFSKLLDQHLSP